MAESYGFGAGGAEEQVERQLASFAFVREEREREVRLHFRDVPAGELAMSFRRSGAGLISMMGERARVTTAPPAVEEDGAASAEDEALAGSVRRRRRSHPGVEAIPPGELTMRYFYSLGEMVYTISIVTPSGVVQSVASVYPNAALPERELQEHLGVVFLSTEYRVPSAE